MNSQQETSKAGAKHTQKKFILLIPAELALWSLLVAVINKG